MDKPRYRFCWECSRKLVGNIHAEVQTPQGQSVIVHKDCAEFAKTGRSRHDLDAEDLISYQDEDDQC